MLKARIGTAKPSQRHWRVEGNLGAAQGALWKWRIKKKKSKIIPKKSYKILDKRKILWYNKSR